MQIRKASLRAWLAFFMHLSGTFSLVAFLVDLAMLCPPFGWKLGFLQYVHHLALLAGIADLLEFIHRQAAVKRWKSVLITLAGYLVVLVSRLVFIP